MKRYWQLRELMQFSAEEIQRVRLHILFYEDMTGKVVLPEPSVYTAEATEDTCYELGAVTKPITKELSKLSSTYQIEERSNAS